VGGFWPPLLLLCCACQAPAHVAPARFVPARSASAGPVRARAASLAGAGTAALGRQEPAVSEVVQMALAAARGLSPERIANLARRARLTGLAPQLRLSAERGLQQDLSSTTGSRSDRTNAAIGDDFSFGATLTFELDRLVFAPDEVRLLSVERWLAGDQRKLVAEVVKLYFQRRRLLRERALTSAPDSELDDSLAELDALLDGLTAGAFGAATTASSAR
jgi:hypothetical protein